MAITFPVPAAWSAMARLLDCFRTYSVNLPEFCSVAVQPGEAVALGYGCDCDEGKNGQAWVRLITQYPSKSFPAPVSGELRCDNYEMAYSIEIGASRCLQTLGMGEDGSGLTDEVLADAAMLQLADANAMRQAITCCFEAAALGQYKPFGPQGGIYGGIFTLAVSAEYITGS